MRLIPAFVDSWDGVTLRVFIEGYTDGADIGMKAEVLYGFSERPDYTGFHIEKGDAVWVFFNDGDPNSPIVMGYRNMNTGGHKDDRRIRHKNIELHASANFLQTSQTHTIEAESTATVKAPQIILEGDVLVKGNVVTQGTMSANGISSEGEISATGDISTSGNLEVTGNIHASGSITDGDGDGGA